MQYNTIVSNKLLVTYPFLLYLSFLLHLILLVNLLYCKGPSPLAARERWGHQAAWTGVTAQHPVKGNMGLAPSMSFDLSGISISVQRLGGVTEEWRTGC